MPHLTPVVGETVIFFSGGAGSPLPAIVQNVTGQALRLIVFAADGSATTKYDIVHKNRWKTAGSLDGFWEYPRAGITDTLAAGS